MQILLLRQTTVQASALRIWIRVTNPNHKTLPANLDTANQWNFVDNEREAYDRPPGPGLTAFGHGTGTIGLLAGRGAAVL